MSSSLHNLTGDIARLSDGRIFGKVRAIQGILVEIGGVQKFLSVGDRCTLIGRRDERVACEVVGFRDDRALAMPFGALDGIGLGSAVEVGESNSVAYPDNAWLGRVIDAFGEPLDGKGPIDRGCRGQRMGVFSASGVGKSILLSMMARYSQADGIVIGLVGERGREVKEFVEEDLGPEGLARSVLVVATSDESPLMRRQAAYMTMTVAEYFRDQGCDVLCLMDSVTRFAMAQREIGLSAGEPPASKGYTPTVFAELPKLLERAGPGVGKGTITAMFAVLVEGDDHNEPISDAVRGIVDGHIVLDRTIAQRNRYPAINILRSISRTMPDCNTEDQNTLINRARSLMVTYEDMAELIRLGAYRSGSDAAVDEAIHYRESLEEFLAQAKNEAFTLDQSYEFLANIFGDQNS